MCFDMVLIRLSDVPLEKCKPLRSNYCFQFFSNVPCLFPVKCCYSFFNSVVGPNSTRAFLNKLKFSIDNFRDEGHG